MKQRKIDNLMKIAEEIVTESTVSGDIGVFADLIIPIVFRIYTQSLVSEIADVQQLKSPVGKIMALFAYYAGRDSDDITYNNTTIVTLSNSTNSFVVDGTISTATGSGTIVYKEGANLLVHVNSGYFTKTQATVQYPTLTVKDLITNRAYARKVFSDYAKLTNTADGELNNNIMNMDYEVVQKTIDVVTRKIKSKFSVEVIQDLQAMYGVEVAKDMLIEEFSSEMIQQIDMEIINFLRNSATPQSDVVLASSYATANDISAVGNDIYLNIYNGAMEIMRETKRKQHFFVIADTVTMSFLLNNPFKVAPDVSPKNSYYMGKLGGLYNLYLDPYSTDRYVLIGYRALDDEEGDAGLIFAPYTTTITNTTDPVTGKEIFFNTVRYGYTLHPQDTGTANGANSIFFRTFAVNTAGIVNFPQGN
jgi:hypothetical protein